jgi:hypothetical protein
VFSTSIHLLTHSQNMARDEFSEWILNNIKGNNNSECSKINEFKTSVLDALKTNIKLTLQ